MVKKVNACTGADRDGSREERIEEGKEIHQFDETLPVFDPLLDKCIKIY